MAHKKAPPPSPLAEVWNMVKPFARITEETPENYIFRADIADVIKARPTLLKTLSSVAFNAPHKLHAMHRRIDGYQINLLRLWSIGEIMPTRIYFVMGKQAKCPHLCKISIDNHRITENALTRRELREKGWLPSVENNDD